MKKNMKRIQKKWRQHGAILAFTALLLPMIIVGTGLAVDLGNIYVQHARLQNAADAAALAGAHAFVENNDKPEKGKHKHADEKAREYIKGTYHNLEQDEGITNYENDEKIFKAVKDNNDIYYIVILEKEVPLYFLGAFYEKIKEKNTFTVPVESVAAISLDSPANPSGKSAFPNLFTFTDGFYGINTAQNPDNVKIAEISSTFTGRIVTNNKTAEEKYRHQLITNEARKKQEQNSGYTVKNAIDDGCVNEPVLDEHINLDFYKDIAANIGNSAAKNFTDNISQTISAQQHFNSSYISANSDKEVIHYTSSNGVDIRFDTNVMGKKDKPLYIIIDNASNPKIQFNANVKNTRPIIYCYLGYNDLWIAGNSGVEFHGVIYAPYAKINVNDNNWHFYGSIVGKSISLNGKGDYTYEDFGISGGSGNSGSSGGANTPAINNLKIKLVSPQSIKWD